MKGNSLLSLRDTIVTNTYQYWIPLTSRVTLYNSVCCLFIWCYSHYQPGPSIALILVMPFLGHRLSDPLHGSCEVCICVLFPVNACDSDLSLIHTASCQDMSCSNQGECIETIGSYTCSCYPGFYGPECEYGEAGTWVVMLQGNVSYVKDDARK